MTQTYDFNDGQGPVPAQQHPNGGGWIADTATVAKTAYVGPSARVYGSAVVFGSARVFGRAEVFGSAVVSDPHSIAWGRAGGYDWTAYVQEEGSPFLRYGCEAHPLSWWLEQDKSLSVKHGEDESHWRFVEAVMAVASTLGA